MMEFKGIAGAAGCAIGHAVIYHSAKLSLEREAVSSPKAESTSLDAARSRYVHTLQLLMDSKDMEYDGDGKAILAAYQEIAQDESFFSEVKNIIQAERVCAAWAIEQKRTETERSFASLGDPYLQARIVDINNVCREVIAQMQGVSMAPFFFNTEWDSLVVFAEELTPADTIRMERSHIKGIITEKGGITSHTVILAKALGIPAVVGMEGILSKVQPNQEVLLDGFDGIAIINPDGRTKARFIEKKNKMNNQQILYNACRELESKTIDGYPIRVNINSGDKESMDAFSPKYCDGIGLLRTEFLYMDQTDYPSEEKQFETYKYIAKKNKGRELIIRTLDIGGDKSLDYMNLPKETNPFLGYRAIRLCLDRKEIFMTQLRAILRTSVCGNVKVMFPMIVNLEELIEAKRLLTQAMNSLEQQKISYNRNIEVGIMVETPAAVMLSDILATHVDFFSIGSNDLIQYTTATDRMNEKVQYLYDSCNISVLRSIQYVCRNAHAQRIKVGICGEIASEPCLIPLWCALGIDELSVAPTLVGRTKYIIKQTNKKELEQIAEKILSQGKISIARNELEAIIKKINFTENFAK